HTTGGSRRCPSGTVARGHSTLPAGARLWHTGRFHLRSGRTGAQSAPGGSNLGQRQGRTGTSLRYCNVTTRVAARRQLPPPLPRRSYSGVFFIFSDSPEGERAGRPSEPFVEGGGWGEASASFRACSAEARRAGRMRR